jgi:hypothetical protein
VPVALVSLVSGPTYRFVFAQNKRSGVFLPPYGTGSFSCSLFRSNTNSANLQNDFKILPPFFFTTEARN